MPTADKLQSLVEDLLVFLSLSEPGRGTMGKHHIPLARFGCVQPLGDDMLFPGWVGFPDVTPRDINFRLDTSVMAVNGRTINVHRVRSIPPKMMRGRKMLSAINVELMSAWVDQRKGTHTTARTALSWYSGKWWWSTRNQSDFLRGGSPSGVPYGDSGYCYDEGLDGVVQIASSIQFNRHYEWHVALGYEDGPTLTFPTTPTGSREVFRLRDIPNGKSRRSALQNWVTEHWRRPAPVDENDATILVREHLRGALKFTWNGLRCTITPSQYDVNRNTKLAEDRRQPAEASR